MDAFEHEPLDIYQAAIEFVVLVDKLTKTFSPGRAYLADQLLQGATAMTRDIAAGASEFSDADKARFLGEARRSAVQCASLLDLCRSLNLAGEEQIASGRQLLLQIVGGLTQLERALAGENRAARGPRQG